MRQFLSLLIILGSLKLLGQGPALQIDSLRESLNSMDAQDTLQGWNRIIMSAIFLQMNELDSAEVYAKSALQTSEEIKWVRGMNEAPMMISGIYMFRSKYVEAIQVQKKLTQSDYALEDSLYRAMALNNLATTYQAIDDHDNAIELYLESIARTPKLTPTNARLSWANLGASYLAISEYDKALSAYDKAISYLIVAEEIGGLETCYINKANCFIQLNELDSAEYYLNLGLSEQGEARLAKSNLFGAGILAGWHLKKENFGTALDMALEVINEAEKVGVPDYYIEMYDIAYKSSLATKDNNLALNFLEHKIFWADSLESDKIKRQAIRAELEIQNEHDKKMLSLRHEQQSKLQEQKSKTTLAIFISFFAVLGLIGIFLWYRSNALKKRRTAELEHAQTESEMKALRAQMDPHFIQNSLVKLDNQIVAGNKESASKFLLKFSDLLRKILVNSQASEILIQEDLNALVDYMELEQMKRSESFTFDIRIAQEVEVDNFLIPSMLLQPFVENCILHGFKSQSEGHIQIDIERKGKNLLISIEDNGQGRNQNNDQKDSDSRHVENGFGLKLSESRLEYLDRKHGSKSAIHYTDLPTGTRVEINLPIIPLH